VNARVWITVAFGLLSACADDGGNGDSAATGGQGGTGGRPVSGGGTQAGGAPTGGARAGTGGAATGGIASGGFPTGGSVAGSVTGGTGGASATGGAVATGGKASTGGVSSTGGASAAGGASPTGGAVATGGKATSTGGAPACTARAGTSTRPQLASDDASDFTIAKYLGAGGSAWDPTAGLGAATEFEPDFTVAADGSGTHTTVQAALTAAAKGTERRYVLVKPGTYREVVSLSGSTPITLYGAGSDASAVVIVNGRSAGDAGGTGASATFTSKAPGLQLKNLTVSNDFATPASGNDLQAVALYVSGDQTVLENVRLHGFQDTFYADSSSPTAIARIYVKSSFIEGDTDFIFGRAVLVIDGGTIHYLSSRKGNGAGVHFAPSTHVDNPYGFLAIGVSFTADGSAPQNKISLGRSWDQSSTSPTPNGQAVVRESTLGAHISKTAPWAAAATSGRAYSATGNRFNEYCNGGPGAGP
jgi:pectinesterase